MLTNLSLLFSAYPFQLVCVCGCECVSVWGEGSGAVLVIVEGGGPELEPSKDWREFFSLVPKEVHCSPDSEDRSWFLAVVLMTLDPTRKDLGFFRLM